MDFGGENPSHQLRYFYSPDAGQTWRGLALPPSNIDTPPSATDVGGPWTRGRGSQIRIGSASFPFCVSVAATSGADGGIYAVAADGTTKRLTTFAARLVGSNIEGTQFLINGASSAPDLVETLDLTGNRIPVGKEFASTVLDGWITPEGGIYLFTEGIAGTLVLYRGGIRIIAASALPFSLPPPGASLPLPRFFAIPTADFSGAWVLQGGIGNPTILSLHLPDRGLSEQWRDSSAPEVEALHAGSSGSRLLIQVHRARPQTDLRILKDPALAVWQVGQPPPELYDELFLNEASSKGFVHLNVETIAGGSPFVFDSGIAFSTSGVAPSAGGGGGDVVQEWGTVRASLRQRLVLPVVARLPGAFGSLWRTDLVLRNPSPDPRVVTLRYLAGSAASTLTRSVSLGPLEIRILRDVLMTSFGLEDGSGALSIEPPDEGALEATSRTYTVSEKGTYGMGVPAIDAFTASSARFPVTFSGSLAGNGFRTNLLVTDAAGRGGDFSLQLSTVRARTTETQTLFRTPEGGQSQLFNLADLLATDSSQTNAIVFQPSSGELIPALILTDNRTNDSTYFSPDLVAQVSRTIPAIVDTEGAYGARWRTDLFLFNASREARTVALAAKPWNSNQAVIELTAVAPAQGVLHRAKVEILDQSGSLANSFEVSVPQAGGIQISDLFRERGLGDGPAAALIRVSPQSGLMGAFATVTDNGTNDPAYFAAVLASR